MSTNSLTNSPPSPNSLSNTSSVALPSMEERLLFAENTLAEISGIETRYARRSRRLRKASDFSGTPGASNARTANAASLAAVSRGAPTLVQAGPGLAATTTGSGASYWDPQPFGRVLTNFVQQSNWNDHLKTSAIVKAWPKIVGEGIAKHTKVTSPADKVLEIETNSTTWAEQLRILLPQIEKNIAEVAGSAVIEEIRIRGPKPRSWAHGKYSIAGRGPRDTYG